MPRGREAGAVNGKLALKIAVSVAMGAVCVYFAARGVDGAAVLAGIRSLHPSTVLLFLATCAVTHLFRAWRWEYLLRPVGVSLPLSRMLPLSSVGFMAILALPVRLGEFVRPYFVTRERDVGMTALLGTVAVERIIDGLLISILFFISYMVSGASSFTPALRFGAWLSLLGFVGLTTFLALARVWTDATIAFALRVSLLHWLAPGLAHKIGERLRALISGFSVLSDHRNFGIFLLQSVIYWGSNGLGMWLLARQMGLPISLGAAYTTMAFAGVVLSLPNSPGLVGQYQLAIRLALLAYLPEGVVKSTGMAYGIVLHGLQTIWYVGAGVLSLPALRAAGVNTSLTDAVRASNRAAEDAAAEADEGLAS
ncbi:MAG TPA: lysylphosphatidylglycerol synthase transmembrane domain-containing protein [Polyangia bacterium]|nr:lysylphosphatidylglycerol synthase transmembrane domain-containing protein [Polyangia bacterium]